MNRNTGAGTLSAQGNTILDQRRAGVLLHPSSLPSATLGDDAIRFLDFLVEGGFSVWQMLPLGPVSWHASPYSLDSAFAGNPNLIPPEWRKQAVASEELAGYLEKERHWLSDYALFSAIGAAMQGAPWWQWPEDLRHRNPGALRAFGQSHASEIEHCIRQQYLFEQAWSSLRREAGQRGILLYGDLPMFMEANSADVWSRPIEFRLERHGAREGQAQFVAGAPPDAFTAEGQCWNNPVYDWSAMQARKFDWWLQRLEHEFSRFDLLRWDHFRGLSATWEIPAGSDENPAHASQGEWRDVPGAALLRSLQEHLGQLPLVAENLGVITPEVETLRHKFGLPGMHVLQFAFDSGDDNPHLPENHEQQGVVYTGTHDNNTTAGWWSALDDGRRSKVRDRLGKAEISMPRDLIATALESTCRLAMLPMQDLMGLGSEARMNIPGEAEGQWSWSFSWEQLAQGTAKIWHERLRSSARG